MCSEGFQARHCEQARELTPDKVYGAGMTAGRLLIAIITTALWLVNMIQSRKQTCHGINGFHHSRASNVQGEQFLSQVSRGMALPKPIENTRGEADVPRTPIRV